MKEKQKLAIWLAGRLGTQEQELDTDSGFWVEVDNTDKHPNLKTWHPAPLDGNFAAAVIAAMRRQRSKVWFYFHEEVSKGLSDVGTEFPMVVCLAARAALEGGTE